MAIPIHETGQHVASLGIKAKRLRLHVSKSCGIQAQLRGEPADRTGRRVPSKGTAKREAGVQCIRLMTLLPPS